MNEPASINFDGFTSTVSIYVRKVSDRFSRLKLTYALTAGSAGSESEREAMIGELSNCAPISDELERNHVHVLTVCYTSNKRFDNTTIYKIKLIIIGRNVLAVTVAVVVSTLFLRIAARVFWRSHSDGFAIGSGRGCRHDGCARMVSGASVPRGGSWLHSTDVGLGSVT